MNKTIKEYFQYHDRMPKTKIGNGSLIWGVILIALSFIIPAIAFYLFAIPIILGLIALRNKDKLGYYGILLGLLSWLISWFLMPSISNILYQF